MAMQAIADAFQAYHVGGGSSSIFSLSELSDALDDQRSVSSSRLDSFAGSQRSVSSSRLDGFAGSQRSVSYSRHYSPQGSFGSRMGHSRTSRNGSTLITSGSFASSEGGGSVGLEEKTHEVGDWFVNDFRHANFGEACDFLQTYHGGFSLKEYWDRLRPAWYSIIKPSNLYRGSAITALVRIHTIVTEGDGGLRLTSAVRDIIYDSFGCFEGYPSSRTRLRGWTYQDWFDLAVRSNWVGQCLVDYPENIDEYYY